MIVGSTKLDIDDRDIKDDTDQLFANGIYDDKSKNSLQQVQFNLDIFKNFIQQDVSKDSVGKVPHYRNTTFQNKIIIMKEWALLSCPHNIYKILGEMKL